VAADTAAGSTTGFRWSSLVSPDTLADEVKEQRKVVATAVGSASEFKGGGYEKARDAFSAVALVFGLIAAHDGDVRWKKDAENARDLFARVGFNCKVGTDGSFAEAKARAADLETLLDGGSPEKKADRDEDFAWSQVAGRSALMNRLEAAEQAAAEIVSSKGEFDKQIEALVRDVEMAAAIGEVIQQKDYEFHDDDTYRGYSAAMRDAALRARDAARKSDYDAARAAVGDLKKSCDTCHGDYRS
jgi:cytochrome c556